MGQLYDNLGLSIPDDFIEPDRPRMALESMVCFICQQKGHLQKDCPMKHTRGDGEHPQRLSGEREGAGGREQAAPRDRNRFQERDRDNWAKERSSVGYRSRAQERSDGHDNRNNNFNMETGEQSSQGLKQARTASLSTNFGLRPKRFFLALTVSHSNITHWHLP